LYVFPPTLLAGKTSKEARTTNGPESFHRHYKFITQFYTSHASIHEVINILLDIQSKTYLKINDLKKIYLNKPRKKFKHIMQTWTKLEYTRIFDVVPQNCNFYF